MVSAISGSVSGPPFFTRRPHNTTVKAGNDVTLECAADGDPPPKTRWRRIGTSKEQDRNNLESYLEATPFFSGPNLPPGGVALDLPAYKIVKGEGLHLRHVMPEQQGLYECLALSAVGSERAIVQLSVHEAPVITRRPVKEVSS